MLASGLILVHRVQPLLQLQRLPRPLHLLVTLLLPQPERKRPKANPEERGPGIVESQDELHPHLPATQANAMQMHHDRPFNWQARSLTSGTDCLMDFQHAAKETDNLHPRNHDWTRSTWCR